MNPSELDCFRNTQFPHWDPGSRVVAQVAAPKFGEWLLIMAIYGVLFGLIAGYVLYLSFIDFVEGASMSFIEAVFVCGIPCSVIGALHLAGGDQTSGELVIDWESDKLSKSNRFGTDIFDLADVSMLVLRCEYETRAAAVKGSQIGCSYNARLDAIIDKNTVLLLATDSRDQVDELAMQKLAPGADELAAAMNVEITRNDPVEQRYRSFFSAIFAAPTWLQMVFVALIAISCVWVAWRAQLF